MATDYPGSLDAFVNPTDSDTLDDPPHHTQHTDINDAMEAVQTELGINPRGAHTDVRERLDEQLGLLGIEYITATGDFEKGDWPGIKKVRVKLVGGGGAGGGCPSTSAGQATSGSGGGAGGYSEKLIDEGDLASTETVTIGAGGTGVSGTTGNAGGTTSFGSHLQATGGSGGGTVPAQNANIFILDAIQGGVGSGGDLNLRGGQGDGCFVAQADVSRATGGKGGTSMFGEGGLAFNSSTTGGNGVAAASEGYGGGGGGAANSASQAVRTGGAGRQGIVIVEVYGSP